MATIICMDGLAGHPPTTFGRLKIALEEGGHRVILADITEIETHEDRISRVLDYYKKERLEYPREKIFLLGQSAGGSAMRIAAERLGQSGHTQIAGVILLSPAMPRGIFFLTPTLAKIMGRRLKELLLGKDIMPTEVEFWRLLEPISPADFSKMFTHRLAIPGKEARHLAFLPDTFRGYHFPTLHIYGDQDQWIAPSAQKRLGKKISSAGSVVTGYIARGAGHVTLADQYSREDVIDIIEQWIEQ